MVWIDASGSLPSGGELALRPLKTIHTINLLTYNRSFPINEGDTKWRRECEGKLSMSRESLRMNRGC